MLATSDGVSFVAHNNGEQTSGGTVGTYKGRKFVPTKDKAAVAAAGKSKIPKNVNLEDLHQAMEDDSTAVDVLKREVRDISWRSCTRFESTTRFRDEEEEAAAYPHNK